jgi:hypothetical protein
MAFSEVVACFYHKELQILVSPWQTTATFYKEIGLITLTNVLGFILKSCSKTAV